MLFPIRMHVPMELNDKFCTVRVPLPVAVLMKRGFGTAFILNIVLTILGWVPGVIHALYVNKE
jgi:uncharacterized membrane protein YqaE (UPF0057 family)